MPLKLFTFQLFILLVFNFSLHALGNLSAVDKPNCKEGSFSIDSRLVDNPHLKFDYRIPVDASGNIPDSANTIIFFAPNMTGAPVNDLGFNTLKDLCFKRGFTVFTVEIQSDFTTIEDHTKCWYYPESGSYDSVFEAYDQLIHTFGLKSQKMFIMGYSGGGSMAQRMAYLNPDKVAAVVLLGGGRYDLPDHPVPIPWLIISTRGDHRKEENLNLTQATRSQGMNVFYAETPPVFKPGENLAWKETDSNFHHGVSDFGFVLGGQFISDLLALSNQGIQLNDYAKWPLVAPLDHQFEPKPNDPAVPVKTTDQLYFPGQGTADLWKKLPYRESSITDSTLDDPLKVLIRYPDDTPLGVVILHGNLSANSADEVDYLAANGFIAIGADLSNNEALLSKQRTALLNWVLALDSLKSSSVFLAGEGLGGRHAILSACANTNPRVVGVAAADTVLDWSKPELSPQEQVAHLSAPLLLVNEGLYDTQGLTDAAQKNTKKVSLTTVPDEKLGAGPFAELDQFTDFFKGILGIAGKGTESAAGKEDGIFPPDLAAANTINFDGRGFTINGEHKLLISGSIHYARYPRDLWHDILLKMKRAGFNTVETPVFWNDHEPTEGKFDFTGERDLGAFLDEAKSLGLYALVNVGPYVDAGWNQGGFPIWLRFKPDLQVRTDNPAFYQAVDPWFDAVLPILSSRQINKGGNVILVQLENEHPRGSGTQMNPYFQHLLDKAHASGLQVPIYSSGLHRAADPVGETVIDVTKRQAPWISDELWTGKDNKYGLASDELVQLQGLRPWKTLAYGAGGFNLYMFAGGTNFDYFNAGGTSYDYGTLVGQTGDLRKPYYLLKRLGQFMESFSSILAQSQNVSSQYQDFAQAPGLQTVAWKSPNGTIIFLNNAILNKKTVDEKPLAEASPAEVSRAHDTLMKDGATMNLTLGEIVPILVNTPLTPTITVSEADTRVLGVVHQEKTTTLVCYGAVGDNGKLKLTFASEVGTASGVNDFKVDRNDGKNITIQFSFPDKSVEELKWKVGPEIFRLLVMNTDMADHTWFVDTLIGKKIVCGPAYVGDINLGLNSQATLSVETPLSETPTDTLIYGPDSVVKIPAQDANATAPASTMTLNSWEMAVPKNGEPLKSNYDDSKWFSNPDGSPPEIGADGDTSSYAWYRVPLPPNSPNLALHFNRIFDNASFYVDGQFIGTMDKGNQELKIASTSSDSVLSVFVSFFYRDRLLRYIGALDKTENKGIIGPVILKNNAAHTPLIGWKMQGGIDPTDSNLSWTPFTQASKFPAFYRTHFQITGDPSSGIVYRFNFTGLARGSIWLNGHNVGRYPEQSSIGKLGLWLPSNWMKSDDNELIIFEDSGSSPARTSIDLEPAACRIYSTLTTTL